MTMIRETALSEIHEATDSVYSVGAELDMLAKAAYTLGNDILGDTLISLSKRALKAEDTIRGGVALIINGMARDAEQANVNMMQAIIAVSGGDHDQP